MLTTSLERELETHTIALNRWLYAEGVGLEVDEAGYAGPAAALARLYAQLLADPDAATRYFALESGAEARRLQLDNDITSARDAHLQAPALRSSEGPLTWRNWKAFEREARTAEQLAEGFNRLVEQSAALVPLLEQRLAQTRADFSAHGLTPIHTFCWREGVSPGTLRDFLWRAGQAARPAFQSALSALSQAVFGRPAGPAELHALYLNRMYEPNAELFISDGAVEAALAAFARIGFDLSHIPVDIENRPRKYPGAFCFPIATPQDVRVSVRSASPHHLVDMLYHEFGHAAHFSGIRADLAFVDRYWIHSGTHETFSTLFEYLLGEPDFLREQFGFDAAAVARLIACHDFKRLLTRAWSGAAGLAALEGWLGELSWPQIEARYVQILAAFTGVQMPPGWARLEPFVNALSIYPAGYVLADARVMAWLKRLRQGGGAAWWRSPLAQAEIQERIHAGGTVRFND
jgi:hypothetical protein